MRYMGGKGRQARYLAPVVAAFGRACTSYAEPFLGGGSIFERVAPTMPSPVGSDVHPDLILMWQALLDGWEPPAVVSRETYYELREAEPSALRGFVGFGCSFGGKWFGGYAQEKPDATHSGDICGPARKGALRKARAMRAAGAWVLLRSYEDLDPAPGTLIYCDPPYAGATAYQGAGRFDPAPFWVRAREWAAAGCVVLVSEYSAPEDVPCVWERGAVVSLRRDSNALPATEKLFALAGPSGFAELAVARASVC